MTANVNKPLEKSDFDLAEGKPGSRSSPETPAVALVPFGALYADLARVSERERCQRQAGEGKGGKGRRGEWRERCGGDATAAPVRSLKERAWQNGADLLPRRSPPLRWGRRGCARSSGARSRAANSGARCMCTQQSPTLQSRKPIIWRRWPKQ